jgi:hypothetical protein
MTGIVELLRARKATWQDAVAAMELGAAEIERLRAALRDQAGVELSEENDRLIAEIGRLRALLGLGHDRP